MKIFKKAIALFVIIILLVSSSSCFEGLFRPVEGAKGLPAYTLTEDEVANAESLLSEAERVTVANKTTYEINVAWSKFIDAYYYVSTQANVAFIRHCMDVTDQTDKENYLYASQSATNLYGKYTQSLKAVYNSEAREKFFEGWSQADIDAILKHDDEVVVLENENSALEVDHSSLSSENFYDGTTDIYKKVVKNNNAIAKKFGYNNYYEYAYANVYGRVNGSVANTIEKYQDFKSNVYSNVIGWIDEMKARFTSSKSNLTQTEWEKVQDVLATPYNESTVNYWEDYLNSLTDEDLKKQLNHAFENENVLFAESNNAREIAFTVYLPDYSKSMCYFGVDYQDVFTVSHEIGHYYANMHSALSNNSMDLNETHSQSNETLLLAYLGTALDEAIFEAVESYVLLNFFTNVLIGVLIDEFEYQIYTKSSVENYTSADFDSVMDSVCEKFGGKAKVEQYLSNVNTYWRKVVVSQPVYYVSYATSAIGAIGLYVQATEDYESAQENYVYLIEKADSSQGFESALISAGYLNPMSNDAFSKINCFVKGVGAVGENQDGGADNLKMVA